MTNTNNTLADIKAKIIEFTQRIKDRNTAQSVWGKRHFTGVNAIHYEEYFPDLIINSATSKVNKPTIATLFDSQKTMILGLFVIPNPLDTTTTLEQFTANFESVRDQFDVLILMDENTSFKDFGFNEITVTDDDTTMTHYRNNCIDFESFKNVFQSKSIVFMRSALGSGTNKAMDAIRSAFAVPDSYKNKILTIKDSIICITTGTDLYTNDEINRICHYSLDQMKTGATLCYDTFENKSLGNNSKISVLISGFDSVD